MAARGERLDERQDDADRHALELLVELLLVRARRVRRPQRLDVAVAVDEDATDGVLEGHAEVEADDLLVDRAVARDRRHPRVEHARLAHDARLEDRQRRLVHAREADEGALLADLDRLR